MRNALFGGVALAALIVPAAAYAQETTSTIRGTVTQDGAGVAGAEVVVTNTSTGARATATTGDDGGFNLPGLQPGGPYSVAVTSPLGNTTVTDIFLVVGQPFNVPVQLAADTTADIVVTASTIRGAGSVAAGPQTVLTQEQISRVASVNRDIRDLARRDPFARIEDTAGGGRSISFAGINPRFNRFSIDGVIVSDNFGLNPDANPTRRGPIPFDSIGQFSVSVAPYDIRQGNFTGGAIDAVLLSGTNEFKGTGFYSYNSDELRGNRIGSNRSNIDFESKTYGATLSGPIIKDKLFFMVSGERNTEGNPISAGIAGEGGVGVPGLTRAQVTQVQQIAQQTYGFATGDVLRQSNDKDEKIVGKLVWNVNDDHRLTMSYINAFNTTQFNQNVNTGNSSPSLGLESNGYALTELLRAGIAQLNSNWTDNFSTEARFLYKSYERGQTALLGTDFAQFAVCLDPTSATIPGGGANPQPTILNNCAPTGSNPVSAATPRVFFGPDSSRQSNEFFTDTYAGSIVGRLNIGNHNLRLLAEYNQVRIFNLFLQNTTGNYYFDSLADFQARRASSVTFQRPSSGNVNDAAADFKYEQWTVGVQDDWAVTDRFNVYAGARFDLYGSRSPVPFNPGFTERYGFANTKTFKGLSIFQPRVGFDWEVMDDVKLRGGYGVFGGGSPDVYLSNSYSNAGAGAGGVGINSVNIQRCVVNTTSCTTGFTNNGATLAAATGEAILNNVNGGTIPAILQAQIPATGPNGLANINAIDPGFNIPEVLKSTLSVDWTPRDLLGGGWRIGADYYFQRTRSSIIFTDFRSIPIGTLPDGRTRFGPRVGTNTNTDIILTNGNRGRSHIANFRVDKTFDWGLNLNFAYTVADVKDEQPATSSTAGSNYGNGAFLGNQAAYGTANDQVAWSFKYGVGFSRAFFGDYNTIFQLFGETQAGRPYSFTMQSQNVANRSPVFGLTGRDDRFLLYVPTGANDPIVSYDSTTTQANLERLIENSKLKNFRGEIAPRNIARSRATTRIDLHLEQQIPTFIGDSRISVFADIENLPNLLNPKWGGFRQVVFPFVEDAVRVQCLSAPVATGTAPATAAINTLPTQTCAQYRYSSYAEPNESNVELRPSLYLIRVGARFTF
jgi:hypothetical protein